MSSMAWRQAEPTALDFLCRTGPMTERTGPLLGRTKAVWKCLGSGLLVLNLGCSREYLQDRGQRLDKASEADQPLATGWL